MHCEDLRNNFSSGSIEAVVVKPMKQPFVIGITGKIATGKSYFCQLFQEMYPETSVFNADQEAKNLLKSDHDLKKYITEVLGSNILESRSSEISHKKFAKRLFSSQEIYNAIVPRIWSATELVLQEKLKHHALNKNTYFFLIESALLWEAGWGKYCEKIIHLEPEKKLHQHYCNARNLSQEDRINRTKLQGLRLPIAKNILKITEKVSVESIQNIYKDLRSELMESDAIKN